MSTIITSAAVSSAIASSNSVTSFKEIMAVYITLNLILFFWILVLSIIYLFTNKRETYFEYVFGYDTFGSICLTGLITLNSLALVVFLVSIIENLL